MAKENWERATCTYSDVQQAVREMAKNHIQFSEHDLFEAKHAKRMRKVFKRNGPKQPNVGRK